MTDPKKRNVLVVDLLNPSLAYLIDEDAKGLGWTDSSIVRQILTAHYESRLAAMGSNLTAKVIKRGEGDNE